MLYTYLDAGGRENYIIYFWQVSCHFLRRGVEDQSCKGRVLIASICGTRCERHVCLLCCACYVSDFNHKAFLIALRHGIFVSLLLEKEGGSA